MNIESTSEKEFYNIESKTCPICRNTKCLIKISDKELLCMNCGAKIIGDINEL